MNKRSKRSLLSFIGTALNTLFGVATEANVEQEEARIDRLEKWAAARGTVINKVIASHNQNAEQIEKLNIFINLVNQNVTKELN